MGFLNDMRKVNAETKTENGAKAYDTTLDANLDFFSQAGAMRDNLDSVYELYNKALNEDVKMALLNLIRLRDIRNGGLGERDAFRQSFHVLIDKLPEVASRLVYFVPLLGRWDDVVDIYAYARSKRDKLVKDAATHVMLLQLLQDTDNYSQGNPISLLAKWLPRKRHHNKELVAALRRDLGFEGDKGNRAYHKILAELNKHLSTVEVDMSAKQFDKIKYETVPSQAMLKYMNAFRRNDEERFNKYIESVTSGEKKMNMGVAYPYEVIRKYTASSSYYDWAPEEDPAIEEAWKNLKDYIGDSEDNIIVAADVSGSMSGQPMDVSVSLAIYCAEKLKGEFHNSFITFTEKPRIFKFKEGTSLAVRTEQVMNEVGYDTNVMSVYDVILKTAIQNNTPQSEMPTKLLFISDMQFNSVGTGQTNFEKAKENFEEAGYQLPKIIFWCVNSYGTTEVTMEAENVATVSGMSASIFEQILKGNMENPMEFMKASLEQEFYLKILESIL